MYVYYGKGNDIIMIKGAIPEMGREGGECEGSERGVMGRERGERE